MILDAISKAQTEIKIVYVGHILAWFCFVLVVQTINTTRRNVSTLILVGFALATVYSIVVGFVVRKKYFAKSAAAFPRDPSRAISLWRLANFTGFSCAISMAVFGAALSFLGSTWRVLWDIFRHKLGLSCAVEASPIGREGCFNS
jgi:hypothetical protein